MTSGRAVMSKRLVWFLMLLALIGTLALVLHRGQERLRQAPVWHPRPVPIETAAVSKRTVRSTISYLARLEPMTTTEVAPEIQARIETVSVDETDRVTQGQLLAKLDDRDIRAQISALKAKIKAQEARIRANRASRETATKTVGFLEREFKRSQELHTQGVVSTSALDASRDNLDSAVGKQGVLEQEAVSLGQELNALTAQLEEAETRLTYAEIRAPMAGTISHRYVEPGDLAKPGSALFTLIDRSSCQLAFDLVQEDLPLVRVGQAVVIRWPEPLPGSANEARVARIFPSLAAERTVRAEVDLPRACSDDTRPGLFVPIDVVVEEADGLTVPREALVPLPDAGSIVYALTGQKLQRVPVEVLLSDETDSLVRGQLAEGQSVAVGEYLQWVRRYEGQVVEVQR